MLGVGSAAAVVVGVVRNKPAHPIAWLCVALALTTFASGDITYDVETEFFHQVNPFPSVADIFYLATVPLLAAGLIMMVRARRRREGDTGATLDALIITSGCAVLSWIFLIHPYVHAKNITLFSEVVSIFYPLGDILVLGVLVRLVFGGGIRPEPFGPSAVDRGGRLVGCRLHLRLDPAARVLEGRRSDRYGLGPVLRVVGSRGAAPVDA